MNTKIGWIICILGILFLIKKYSARRTEEKKEMNARVLLERLKELKDVVGVLEGKLSESAIGRRERSNDERRILLENARKPGLTLEDVNQYFLRIRTLLIKDFPDAWKDYSSSHIGTNLEHVKALKVKLENVTKHNHRHVNNRTKVPTVKGL